MATKHDLILTHIESLPVGERISVRFSVLEQFVLNEN